MAAELFALLFLLHLIVACVVALDAKHNSRQSPLLWGLVVLVAGFLLGVLLYLLLGRDTSASSSRQRPRTHNSASTAKTEDDAMNVDDSGPF